MGRAIGIDLGTTNCVAAIKEATVRVLQSREGEDFVPSVVTIHKHAPLVGRLALDRMSLAPENTIQAIKRLIGRSFRDDNVRRVRERYSYTVVPPRDGTDDEVCVVLDGKEYSPIQVTALILEKIKQDAELRLSDAVEYAVITVPAYFNEKQKDATRKAGQLAGLKVQKVLDEPTAAAIAFGLGNVGAGDAVTILVYDLGGGTFDASVITLAGGAFVQLNIECDMWLGGDDFDHHIMEHVYDRVQAACGIDARGHARFRVVLRERAERAKRALSSAARTDIVIPGMLKDAGGNPVDVDVELSRTEFERMIEKDVARSIDMVKTALTNAGAGMTPDQIDYVLPIGGSSQIPLVRRSLGAVFGEQKILTSVDPMTCVAHGAAILSAACAETVECPRGHANPGRNVVCDAPGCGESLTSGVVVASVTSMPYGLQAPRDVFLPIIPKGTNYPTVEPVHKRLFTPAPDLKRIRVPVYAGLDPIASKNDLQATLWLELPDGVPADTPVDIAFRLDSDGILERVEAVLLDGSGTRVGTYLDRGGQTGSLTPASSADHDEELVRANGTRERDAGRRGDPVMPARLDDRVHFSVTAPPAAAPGSSFLLDVWAHLEQQRAEVLKRAREMAGGSPVIHREKGPVLIARGTVLTVQVHAEGLVIAEPQDTILWDGEVGNASFLVSVPAGAKPGARAASARFRVEGLEVARLQFILTVGDAVADARPLETAQTRHRTAFASYASEDAHDVLTVIQGLQKGMPDLDVFYAEASLRSGQRWPERLRAEIAARDVFYLFWSQAASESYWVGEEWRFAYAQRGVSFIDPVPLAPPELVPPPPELAGELHFNDWTLAYKRRGLRGN